MNREKVGGLVASITPSRSTPSTGRRQPVGLSGVLHHRRLDMVPSPMNTETATIPSLPMTAISVESPLADAQVLQVGCVIDLGISMTTDVWITHLEGRTSQDSF